MLFSLGVFLVCFSLCSGDAEWFAWPSEGDYYSLPKHMNYRASLPQRQGQATNSHSCSNVRAVPSHVRNQLDLSSFYQKYTEAYGIPILSSSRVPDTALQRACYVARFIFADRYEVRNQYYKQRGRFAVMAQSEVTRNIPEHSFLTPFWDTRARGLGATPAVPVSSCAEENALCYRSDRYRDQDIVLHEFAHGLHLVGANFAVSGFDSHLKEAYNSAKQRGLWSNTYAMSTHMEYFAEGVTSFFNQNSESRVPNGIKNHVNTRTELKSYDHTLYRMIKQMFPCNNQFINRCDDVSQKQSLQTRLKMNYPACVLEGDDGSTVPETTRRPTEPESTTKRRRQEGACVDENRKCGEWAGRGECNRNPKYMLTYCKRSCNKCDGGTSKKCENTHSGCKSWAHRGLCRSRPDYMNINCRKACGLCKVLKLQMKPTA